MVNLPMEQDGELNAKQGLEEASVEKLPVEQPGAAARPKSLRSRQGASESSR